MDYFPSLTLLRGGIEPEDSLKAREMRYANDVYNQWTKLEHGNQNIFMSVGERLVQALAADADASSKIVQSLAFSVLDWLVRYDISGKWTHNVIMRSGYMKSYLTDLKQSSFLQ